MNRLCHILVVVTAAVASALALGCASAQPAASPPPLQASVHAHHHHGHHHHATREEANRCASLIPGTWFSAQDTPDGARLVYGTEYPAYVRTLRDAVHHQAQAPLSRKAAATLSNAQVELPPINTSIEYTPDGAAVTYAAVDPKNVERVRLLVRWDAAAQRLGNCSILKVPADTMASNQGKPTMLARASGGGLGEWVTNVEIDPELGASCGIPPEELSFAFDWSEARPRAYPVLRLLAHCMDKGPVAGMKLKVIGYSSPDTGDAYTDQTGVSRSETIADYLGAVGAARGSVIAYPKGDPKSPGSHAAMRTPSRTVVIKAVW